MDIIDASPTSIGDLEINTTKTMKMGKAMSPRNLEAELTEKDESDFSELFNVITEIDDRQGTVLFSRIAALRDTTEAERFQKAKHDKSFNNEDTSVINSDYNGTTYFNALSQVYESDIARPLKVMNELYESEPLEISEVVSREHYENFDTTTDTESITESIASLDWSETIEDIVVHEHEYQLRAIKLAKRLSARGDRDEVELSSQLRAFQLSNYIAARTRIAADNDFHSNGFTSIFQASTKAYQDELNLLNVQLGINIAVDTVTTNTITDEVLIQKKLDELVSTITEDDQNTQEMKINHFKAFIDSMTSNQQKLEDVCINTNTTNATNDAGLSVIEYNKLMGQDALIKVISNIALQVNEIITTKLQNEKVLKTASRNLRVWKLSGFASGNNGNNNLPLPPGKELSIEYITKKSLLNFNSFTSSSLMKIMLVLDAKTSTANLKFDNEVIQMKMNLPETPSINFDVTVTNQVYLELV